jgi:hypothetical protein
MVSLRGKSASNRLDYRVPNGYLAALPLVRPAAPLSLASWVVLVHYNYIKLQPYTYEMHLTICL